MDVWVLYPTKFISDCNKFDVAKIGKDIIARSVNFVLLVI